MVVESVRVSRVQPGGGGGPRGGERGGVPQTFCGEARVRRGPQRLHLLPNVRGRRQPEAFSKGKNPKAPRSGLGIQRFASRLEEVPTPL